MSKVDVENGKKLIGFRKQNGLSKEEVCNIIGYKYSQLYRFEQGYVAMPQSVIEILNSKYNLKLKKTSRCKEKPAYTVTEQVERMAKESFLSQLKTKLSEIVSLIEDYES